MHSFAVLGPLAQDLPSLTAFVGAPELLIPFFMYKCTFVRPITVRLRTTGLIFLNYSYHMHLPGGFLSQLGHRQSYKSPFIQCYYAKTPI